MVHKIANVFQKQGFRALYLGNASNVVKQCALSIIKKPVCFSERIPRGNSCETEWLARKAGGQDVMIRNNVVDMFFRKIGRSGFPNIAERLNTVVTLVGSSSLCVNFGRKNTIASSFAQCNVETANPSKQIYKCEPRHSRPSVASQNTLYTNTDLFKEVLSGLRQFF